MGFAQNGAPIVGQWVVLLWEIRRIRSLHRPLDSFPACYTSRRLDGCCFRRGALKLDQPRRHFSPPRHSKAEIALQHLLIEHPLATGFKREHQEGRYRLDFFFAAWKLGVEIDSQHFHDPEKDAHRDRELARIGIVILRLSNVLPAEKLREHIAYVAERIVRLPLAEKVLFVRNYKVSILDAIVDAQVEKKKPDEDCLDCNGSGWKMVPTWHEGHRQAELRATRCDCTNLRQEFQLWSPDDFAPPKPPQQAPLIPPAESLRNRA